jgi:hypothetical protein
MNILEIAKSVGAAVIKTVVPGGALLIDAVNMMLPDDKQLPSDTTGDQVARAVNGLTPDLKAKILLKEFDVQLASIRQTHDTARTMLIQDAINPQSTRPAIALKAFYLVAIISMLVVLMWCYAVINKDTILVKEIMDGWVWVGAIVAPFVLWLNRYFGIISTENNAKLNASNGLQAQSAGIVERLFKR